MNISDFLVLHYFRHQIDYVLSGRDFETCHEMFGIEGSHSQVSSIELVGQLVAVLVQATVGAVMNKDWSLLSIRTVSEKRIVG